MSFSIVLLLGSYDKNTKKLLNDVKEEIAKTFTGEVFGFLLDNLELYMTNQFQVLVEIENQRHATLYFFDNSSIKDVEDLYLTTETNLENEIYNHLKKEYNVTSFTKVPLAEKYAVLLNHSLEIFLLRHKEETRGGEYVELMHILFSNYQEKLWFFKNCQIAISSMLEEYLDKFRVKIRDYESGNTLNKKIVRVIQYSLLKSKK